MQSALPLSPNPARNGPGEPTVFDFSLPPELEAAEPPEARGLQRDQVRLMVSKYTNGEILHTRFAELPNFLEPGDVLVINTSGTRNSALHAYREDGSELELHLSTHLDEGSWTVEPRSIYANGKSKHFEGAIPGETLKLPEGGTAVLHEPYVSECEPGITAFGDALGGGTETANDD